MDKTTQEFVKHIAQEIEAGNCIFFLGVDVSIEAGMPGGSELAEMLTRKAGWEYHGESLQQVAEKYATMKGPVKPVIQTYLKQRLAHPEVGPTDAHRALVCIADQLNNILTTNWDNLLEDAFDAAGKTGNYQIVYRDAHVITLQQGKTSIVKLHGHLDDPDSYVVTQRDYQAFEDRTPNLAHHLRSCLTSFTLVIIGYGQEDANFQDIYEETLKQGEPWGERRPVYVVNPREDIAWEQYWRDKAKERFIRMSATEFLMSVYREVKGIADREEELKLGHNLIPCPHNKPVIEFCGLPGIGKSTLLKGIRKEYEKLNIHTASINFENPDFCEDSKAGYRLIWDDIVRQLWIRANYANREELREQLKSKKQVVLFFDAVDQAPIGTVRWVGDTFVALMDELPDLRAVFACRSFRLSSVWKFPYKHKVETQRLTPFRRLADTQRQMELEFFYDKVLAQLVHDLTMGHPGMVQRATEWLRKRKVRSFSDLEHADRAELGRFIDGLLDTYILGDVNDALKPVIRRLAYYRQFRWAEVGHVLGLPLPESYPKCDSFIRDKLLPTGLVERGKWYPYAIDQTARKLFLNTILLQNPKQFVAESARIGMQYDERAKRLTENWHLYVVECLYHLANALQGKQQDGETVDMTEALLSKLNEYLRMITSMEGLFQLRESLSDDREFETLVERVHQGLFASVLQAVEERGNGLGENGI